MAKRAMRKENRKTFLLYTPAEDQYLIDELIQLQDKTKVSVSILIRAAVRACLPDLKRYVPNRRTFTLNGRKVSI